MFSYNTCICLLRMDKYLQTYVFSFHVHNQDGKVCEMTARAGRVCIVLVNHTTSSRRPGTACTRVVNLKHTFPRLISL